MSSEESKHDQQFYDRFMVVMGILIAVAVFLFIAARWIGVAAQTENSQSDPYFQEAVGERIAPAARVAISGQDFEEEGPEVIEPEVVREPMTGPQVYNQVCSSCHSTGLAGAPKTGDAAAWDARVAAGMDSVNGNAINGFQGDFGFMPPKGGRTDLSDEEIIAAVEYMIDQL